MSSHFGEQGHYVLMESETGVCTPHAATAALCKGPCRCLMPESSAAEFDVVICRAIGHRVLLDYRRRGIAVYITSEVDPQRAWQAWRAEALQSAARSFCRTGRRKPIQKAQPIALQSAQIE